MKQNLFAFFSYADENKYHLLPNCEEISALLESEDGFLWLHFHDPSIEDLDPVAKVLKLHPLAIEDCVNEDQLPKLESFNDHIFLILNNLKPGKESAAFLFQELDCFLGKKFLVTVCKGEFAIHTAHILKRGATSSALLLYVIAQEMMENKLSLVEDLQDDIDEEEELILRDQNGSVDIAEVVGIRRKLVNIRKSVVYEREVFTKLYHRYSKGDVVSEEASYYFRDLYDQLSKIYEMIEMEREEIANLMEIFLSLKSNRLSIVSYNISKTMKRLTLITMIFMPLTLLSGIGGMSEWTMMTGGEANWALSYSLFMVLLVVVASLCVLLLKLLKWW
ncbi:MAG: magnesium transporter CorA family protein [Oligoflexia bacterium]|nr:magnesium transporter CorA family protein [Oligoflexia bacterium]MBF0365492.1 magnesium transporter CorA family protein [Oligoflexia bacterium]